MRSDGVFILCGTCPSVFFCNRNKQCFRSKRAKALDVQARDLVEGDTETEKLRFGPPRTRNDLVKDRLLLAMADALSLVASLAYQQAGHSGRFEPIMQELRDAKKLFAETLDKP